MYLLVSLTTQGLAYDSRLMVFDLENDKEEYYTPSNLYRDYFDVM